MSKTDHELIIPTSELSLLLDFMPEWNKPTGDSDTTTIDWNTLMSVVEKVNQLENAGYLAGIDWDILKSMHEWISYVKLENAYQDLVTVIKWYNQQKVNGR